MNQVLNQIVILREQVHSSCETLCRSAVQGDIDELQSAMVTLQDKVYTTFLCLLQWVPRLIFEVGGGVIINRYNVHN